MVMINVVDGEYSATATNLQQVSSELQGAKIDDLSEAVEASMKGATAMGMANLVEVRYTDLLLKHSQALEDLAQAARQVGVNLAQTEADNTQQACAQGQNALSGTSAAGSDSNKYAARAAQLNDSSDGYSAPRQPGSRIAPLPA